MKNALRKIRISVKKLLGQEPAFKPEIDAPIEVIGSEYGGWGLDTSRLNSESVIYSFGVGEDASFDLELIKRWNMNIHAFDPTPKSIQWVKRQSFPQQFILHEYGLAKADGEVSFNPPADENHVSHTMLDRPSTSDDAIRVQVKGLDSILAELGHNNIDVLKMDIEGAEYEVIEGLEHSPIRPKQILVEFHHRFPSVGVTKTRDAVRRLRGLGYRLAHVAASNEEYTFIHTARQDR